MICGIYSISHNGCIYTVADLKDKSLINNKK